MKKIFWTVLLAIIWLPLTAQVSAFDKEKMDAYFNAIAESGEFMGSIAVAKNGEVLYQRSIGWADLANKKAADNNTVYRIGSISKTFTAVLLLKAVEQNLTSLDTRLSKFFPQIQNANNISLQHLLQHSSGIPNVTDDSAYLSWNTKPISKETMIAKIAANGSDFTPGTKAAYSNSNYILLTHIVSAIFKKSYQDLVKEFIITPLNLKRTFIGKKINPSNNESFSYEYDNGWKISSETDMSVPEGAGNIVATPTDLTQFMHGLMQGKLLNAASLNQMKTIEKGFGLGLFPIPFYDKKGFGHTGGIDGFRSVACYFPSDSISYALTANGTAIETNNISIAVLSILNNRSFTIPSFTKIAIPDSTLIAYTGKYASATLPIQIVISKDANGLRGQVVGQSSFPLKAINTQKFSFEQAGVIIEFNLTNKELTLQQAGQKLLFKKE